MFNFNKNKKKEKNIENLENVTLDKKIEVLLFYKGEELSLNFLSKHLYKKKKEIKEALVKLKQRLENSGIILVENENSYLLSTRKEYAELIKSLENKEETGELSKSALETLAIILYKGPLTKVAIDEFRGINSSYILRNLLIRGLVERKKDFGKSIYLPSIDLFRFLGIANKESLPDYSKILEKVKNLDHG